MEKFPHVLPVWCSNPESSFRLTVECPLGTQCPRYRGCLPAIFYGTEKMRSHISARHSIVILIQM